MWNKALFFINSEVGGAERMGVLISKMLISANNNVEYVVIEDLQNKTSITDFINEKDKITIVRSNSYFDKFRQFYKIIKDKAPTHIFSTNYSVNDKLLLLKPLFKDIKFVVRSDFYYNSFSWKEKLIIRCTYRSADVLIAQNEEMRQEFIKHKVLPSERIVTLENPVDKESIDNKLFGNISPYQEDGRKHIVAVGRVSFQKGYDILVRSLELLIRKEEKVDLYIVGSYIGMWEEEYKRIIGIIKQMGIEKYVHFLGYQENPYIYVKYADCFVLSSRWEGLPNVLAEALYLKKPVAAFKCIPIIGRMVRDGIDGYLAEKEDVDGLANAIEKALLLEHTNPIYQGATSDQFIGLFS